MLFLGSTNYSARQARQVNRFSLNSTRERPRRGTLTVQAVWLHSVLLGNW